MEFKERKIYPREAASGAPSLNDDYREESGWVRGTPAGYRSRRQRSRMPRPPATGTGVAWAPWARCRKAKGAKRSAATRRLGER